MKKIAIDETPIWMQELNVMGVYGHAMEEWQGRKLYTFDLFQEWIRDGIYKTEGFVTHHFFPGTCSAAWLIFMPGSTAMTRVSTLRF